MFPCLLAVNQIACSLFSFSKKLKNDHYYHYHSKSLFTKFVNSKALSAIAAKKEIFPNWISKTKFLIVVSNKMKTLKSFYPTRTKFFKYYIFKHDRFTECFKWKTLSGDFSIQFKRLFIVNPHIKIDLSTLLNWVLRYLSAQ